MLVGFSGFEFTPLLILGLLLLGFCVGLVATIGGIGGGPLVMPIFLLLLKLDPNLAKGTSIFMILLSSGIGTYVHYKNRKIHLPSLLLLAGIASLGSFTCFLVQDSLAIDNRLFNILFGSFELFVAGRFAVKAYKEFRKASLPQEKLEILSNLNLKGPIRLFSPRSTPIKSLQSSDSSISTETGQLVLTQTPAQPKSVRRTKYIRQRIIAFPLFFLAGFLATFLGIGGGPVNTPVFYELLDFPLHFATASSTGLIFFNSIFNVINYGLRGEINWALGGIMGSGMMVGAFVGAKHASRVPRSWTLVVLAGLMILAGGKMILG